ncbi:MAG: DUF2461 family protein, partial [Hymenobacter sp.]
QHFFPQGLQGEQLKKMPPGYAATHSEAQWLRHKSFLLSHELPDATVRSLSADDFRAHVVAALRAVGPFCEWLSEAACAGQ